MDSLVQIRLFGSFAVAGESEIPAGAWRLRKAKSLVKLLALSPGRRLHREQVMELLAGESDEATPTGGGPSFADFEPVGGLGWLSPGLTAWTEVDLSPATYVALCFVYDPETGLPHVAMGMVAVFTVGEVAATPVS